eukprot:SAG31_NODE_12358_length_947_cov_2.073113_1_plen_89_part_00
MTLWRWAVDVHSCEYFPLLVLPGTAQVLVLQVLDCRYWYCWYVILLLVGVVGVHGCIISHMYTPHFNLLSIQRDLQRPLSNVLSDPAG